MIDEFLTTARSSPLVRAPLPPSPPCINDPKSSHPSSVPVPDGAASPPSTAAPTATTAPICNVEKSQKEYGSEGSEARKREGLTANVSAAANANAAGVCPTSAMAAVPVPSVNVLSIPSPIITKPLPTTSLPSARVEESDAHPGIIVSTTSAEEQTSAADAEVEVVVKKAHSIAFAVVLDCTCSRSESESRTECDLSLLNSDGSSVMGFDKCTCLAPSSNIILPAKRLSSLSSQSTLTSSSSTSSISNLPSLSIKARRSPSPSHVAKRKPAAKRLTHHLPLRKRQVHKKRGLRRCVSAPSTVSLRVLAEVLPKKCEEGTAKISSIETSADHTKSPKERASTVNDLSKSSSTSVRFEDNVTGDSLETLVDEPIHQSKSTGSLDTTLCDTWSSGAAHKLAMTSPPPMCENPLSPSSSVAATMTSPVSTKPSVHADSEDEGPSTPTSTSPISSPVEHTPTAPCPSPRSPLQPLASPAPESRSPAPSSREDLLPPITRYTLRELDIHEIVNNSQLRHDLLFDPDMQFRPNLDGDRGAIKQKKAERYWSHVRAEIEGRRSNLVRSPKIKGGLDKIASGRATADVSLQPTWTRVPLLIKEIKEILLELVPYTPGFESSIHQYLDVPLLLQQLSHQALTPVPIIAFITSHLHQYCAPCRDDLVSDVLQLFKFGHYTAGLRKLLSVLELMKLDFANHHLRKLRPWIVENAEEFEWKGFRESWVKGKGAGRTVRWLERGMRGRNKDESAKAIYNQALMSMITSPDIVSTDASTHLPETLSLDLSRLQSFHNDWQDISIVCTLLLIFRQVTGPSCTSADISEMKRVLWILLNDSDTMMTNVTLQLASNASKIRGKDFTTKETTLLTGLVDKTLSFENKMYDLVQTHVANRILHVLNSGRMETKEQLERFGLRELEEEVRELAERVEALASHNRRTYRILYDAVFDRWRKSDASKKGEKKRVATSTTSTASGSSRLSNAGTGRSQS